LDSGYQQEPVARGAVRFTIVPAPLPPARLRPLAVAAVVAALAGVLLFRSEGPWGEATPWLRVAVAIAAGCGAHEGIRRLANAAVTRTRSPGGSFVVSASSIETVGGAIARTDVRRLVVTNRLANASLGPKARDVSYALSAECAQGCTILAGGMRRHTALGLLADVSRILRLRAL
jgi:hypothetical protein